MAIIDKLELKDAIKRLEAGLGLIPSEDLKALRTQFNNWLMKGKHHPDLGGNKKNFDDMRVAYDVVKEDLESKKKKPLATDELTKEGGEAVPVGDGPKNYDEFIAAALMSANLPAATRAWLRYLWRVPFKDFLKGEKK